MLGAYAQAAQAQTIYGVVLDDSTSLPIAGAEVILRDSSGNRLVFEVSDREGRFVLEAEPGVYLFEALRMGYAPTVTPQFAVPEGSPSIDLTILLPSERVVLEPVVVTETRLPFAPGPLQGFYERKRRGWGLQLTSEEIEERIPSRFTDILRGLPGVRVVSTGGNKYFVQMVGQAPRLQPEAYNAADRHRVRTPTSSREGQQLQGCPVSYYLDGVKYEPDERGIDEILVSEVEAVEVYRRASETPADFLDSDSRCGVIVIWTKR
jgi:hypothetical protein